MGILDLYAWAIISELIEINANKMISKCNL